MNFATKSIVWDKLLNVQAIPCFPVKRLLCPFTKATFSAPLFFANCELFRERIEARIAAAPHPVSRVVVDGAAIHDIDLMACDLLVELERELRAKGITLAFGNLRDRVRRDIERGLQLAAGDGEGDIVYPTVAAAVAPACAATVERHE